MDYCTHSQLKIRCDLRTIFLKDINEESWRQAEKSFDNV